MKNLAITYIEKTSKHLFTKDGKTFMKIISVGNTAIKIEFGEKQSIKIIPNIEKWEVKSSAGKIYLLPELKFHMFPQWGHKYRAVKHWKSLKELFDLITNSFNSKLDYSNYKVRNKEEERIEKLISSCEMIERKIKK